MTTIPTLDELNDMPAELVELLMLRCLNASDFTFRYQLFDKPVLNAIIDNSESLLKTCELDDECALTTEQKAECAQYLFEMRE